MLILTRRCAETIYIGEQVTVTVLGVVGNQVRFGIEAPRSITIDRAEVHERKKRAQQHAAGTQNACGGGGTDVNGNVENPKSDERSQETEEVNGNK